jgi:hypothetical protein
MKKEAKKKSKKVAHPKVNIQKLRDSRDGGQIALRGYSYQFLYSCYLILSSSSLDISFQLEGIEDIDCIKQKNGSSDVIHIQLKYSVNKQDASFMPDVLKNFLEAYLLDQNRSFKLVYDFPVAKGYLSKLFESDLDDKSRAYWIGVISNIKQNNPSWNWAAYDFDKFISCLSFEKIEKATLAAEIEKALIEAYEISTDNIALFANSIKILCFEKMEQRAYVTKDELDLQIQSVKIDISKGPQNPAHSWIRKLDYSKPLLAGSRSFYEGKKATPADIACGLPIERPGIEKDIINSICENTVTVIKASSGQGKTTLALRVAYILQKEYTPYQLLWCDEIKEIGNIVQYFKARVQLGEKLLILIDNLDNHLGKWNYLAQLLQSELHCHYKLLVTSRETDWYNFSGDLSNVQSLNVIKPVLEEKEAIEIFNLFRAANQLHPSITGWQRAWNKIAERQLLIEYVYLLTHGEMLSERIASQISEIGQSPSGKAKCEILRKVCFADVCGVRLSIAKLYVKQFENSGSDFGELLKSMESEFLVHVNTEGGYIEGLHPIRSKHIVERLHEFLPLDNTAISVIEIAEIADIPVLFSHLPEFDLNKDEFFSNVVEVLWDEKDLSNYIPVIQGLFSGSVMQYYRSNQAAFIDANAHGGLPIISIEMCPFVAFKEFGVSIETLDKMRGTFPDNKNIEYLCELRDRIPNCNLQETFVYAFCGCLYKKLHQLGFAEIKDIVSYAAISDWIYSVDSNFNLSANISLDNIWIEPEKLTLECVSTLMYISYCGNKDVYMEFIERNLDRILTYLKYKTKSHRLFIDHEKNAIHVEYILRLRDIKAGNEKSVSRLKYICRTLPIFDLYCADALKPIVNLLSAYTVPDDAHKEMPIRNIVIMFHQNLTSLWSKTIMSNYEFDTVTDWFDYWFDVRERICVLENKFCACIYKLLGGKPLGSLAREVDQLREELAQINAGERLYPKENRPFEEKATVPAGLGKIKNKYFGSMQNFTDQFVGFLLKDEQKQRLAVVNLTAARSSLATMQNYFGEIVTDFDFQTRHLNLCNVETQSIDQLIMCCSYYQMHSPNPYFNKYQIKDWYIGYCKDERDMVEEGLSQLQSKYSIHFPDQIYTLDTLSYYPIIVDNFDMVSESNLMEWLYGCISFAKTSFDYLVILSSNESGRINPTALQFPRQMFVDVKKTIESENHSLPDKLIPPYPVDVTRQMLGCFIEKYDFPEKTFTYVDALPIGDVAEELWIYSKSVELLTEPEYASYLTTEIQEIQTNISGMLRLLKDKLSIEDIDWLVDICNDVFAGKRFDDVLFNDVIEHFAQKHVGKESPSFRD